MANGLIDLTELLKIKYPNMFANQQPISPLQEMASSAAQSNPDVVFEIVSRTFKNPSVVAGLMGNIQQEAGSKFDYRQKQIGGGGGEGLFQFTYEPMKKSYNNYLKKINSPNSAESQVSFVNSIINSDEDYDIGAGNRKKLKEAFSKGDVETITEEISNRILRPGKPHIEKRKLFANEWYKKIRSK